MKTIMSQKWHSGRMANPRILLLLAIMLAGAVFTAAAQSPPSSPDSILRDILTQLPGTALGLEDAIRSSVTRDPAVLSAGAMAAAAQGVVRRESGAFEPQLFLGWTYRDDKLPAASFFSGASVLHTLQAEGNAGLTWNLPIGTSITASLDAVRLNTNSSFAFLSPQYTTTGALVLRQPLLRGFSASARKGLTSAERQAEAAEGRFNQEMLSLRTRVEILYWDLYASERDFAVQMLTRDRAAAFLRETEVKSAAGLIGPNQVANARTFLSEQEILLLDREEQLDRLSDMLAATIGGRPDPTQPRFRTVDHPRDTFPVSDVDSLVQAALEGNLALRAVKAEIEAHQALARAAAWEALPGVDLVGALGGNGLAGTARDVIFGNDTLRTLVGGGFGDAIGQVAQRDFPNWHVGLELNVPIGFSSGLGEQDRLEAEVEIAQQRYEQEERMLEAEVRSRSRELMHGQQRLGLARQGVLAAQEQVRIGLIEFQNGRSTAFELVRLGADFAVAQQRYSQALVRSAKAAAALRQLTSGAYDPE
ncbi:MAG TPA: TolC family protein [Bacteroidota bacterium]|nr:TolC family protein [Bacteroidota bacterium]